MSEGLWLQVYSVVDGTYHPLNAPGGSRFAEIFARSLGNAKFVGSIDLINSSAVSPILSVKDL
jgi:hypothetical protein